MLILKFPFKFTDNPVNENERSADRNIEAKLQTPENLSGIFNWVYEGYKKLKHNGKFTIPNDQKEQMEEYKETANPIVLFVKEFDWTILKHYSDKPPVFETVNEMTNQELYDLYSAWSVRNGYVYKNNLQSFKREFSKCAKDYRNDIENYCRNGVRGIKKLAY